jgi:hypothetical protein
LVVFGVLLSLTLGLTVAPRVLFDGNWREVVGDSSPLLLTLLSFGLVSGGLLGAVFGNRVKNNPGLFIVVTAAALVVGVAAVFFGQHLFDGRWRVAGIAVAAFAAEAGATGMILGIFEIVGQRVPPAKRSLVITIATLAKFGFSIAASMAGTPVWQAAGWSGITALMVPIGLAALASAIVFVHLYGRHPPADEGQYRPEQHNHGPPAGRPTTNIRWSNAAGSAGSGERLGAAPVPIAGYGDCRRWRCRERDEIRIFYHVYAWDERGFRAEAKRVLVKDVLHVRRLAW